MANEPYFATNYMERFQAVERNGKLVSRIMHNDKCVYNFLDSMNRWEPGLKEICNQYPTIAPIISHYPEIAPTITAYPGIVPIIIEYPEVIAQVVANAMVNILGNKHYWIKIQQRCYIKFNAAFDNTDKTSNNLICSRSSDMSGFGIQVTAVKGILNNSIRLYDNNSEAERWFNSEYNPLITHSFTIKTSSYYIDDVFVVKHPSSIHTHLSLFALNTGDSVATSNFFIGKISPIRVFDDDDGNLLNWLIFVGDNVYDIVNDTFIQNGEKL